MKIQLACDFYCLEDALKVLKEIVEEIDIIEVGTDLMLAEGTRALRIIKETYPDKILLSDIKMVLIFLPFWELHQKRLFKPHVQSQGNIIKKYAWI